MPNRRSMSKHLIAIASCLTALGLAVPASAQTVSIKLSADLAPVVSGGGVPASAWLQWLGGQPVVNVLITASSSDASLASLRQAVLANGGSVHYAYQTVRAMSGLLPVAALNTIAARSDVLFITPNRTTARSGSLVQDSTGASAVPRIGGSTPVDGRGVGIAVLDSGIDWDHRSMQDAVGNSRVVQTIDVVGMSRAFAFGSWVLGVDYSDALATSLRLGSSSLGSLATRPMSRVPDPYGHGTHVAAIAAGAGGYQVPDSTGVAPGATLYDVRVLDERGIGNMANVLAGIDWVMLRTCSSNIRVMNLSLAASSTDSFLVDPLARAARGAVAAGVVVAAGGNYGKSAAGVEQLGTVGSPGHEPSVITVGAANPLGTALRSVDLMTGFSSRGPSRGGVLLPSGSRWIDNLIKPDLVAPGNRLLGAASNEQGRHAPAGNRLGTLYPQLMQEARNAGAGQALNQELIQMSGTSMAAPAVADAAALLLQANPGLTPPLVKAILQYTAQPLAGAHLLQQGSGQLNVEGAVRLAQALRTDIRCALAAGTLKPGDNLLAAGKSLPLPTSTIAGQTVAWGRIASAGGGHLVSGDALFNRFQPI